MYVLITEKVTPLSQECSRCEVFSVQYFLDVEKDKAEYLLEKSKKFWENTSLSFNVRMEHYT